MKFAAKYVYHVENLNYRIGRIMMYGIFAMVAILLWSSFNKTFFEPTLWTLEMAQFMMVAYYMLGGPYSIQLGSNVRMDLFYGELSLRRKATFDCITVVFLLFYLIVLLYGAISSTAYSLGHFGTEPFSFFIGLVTGSEELGFLERSNSSWRPYMWPIKSVMCVAILLMLLQAISEFIKDIAKMRGINIEVIR